MHFLLLLQSFFALFFLKKKHIQEIQKLRSKTFPPYNIYPLKLEAEFRANIPRPTYTKLDKWTEKYFEGTHFGNLEKAREYFEG